ncbi:MAG TPA: UDP-N-acetylglucosamine 2-epimerase [Baekduia sp.]|uniref:UDP-N-acetylglucosamine 2-epimerase n=1 Tax=Baekduia sp. TaxID=2600305 RepID=UPI002C30E96D|nr:UDP-N-acetylglucosamine 2-epimerase [Baekduia sp.]HMJ34002.1 UDP-N-acetylglucosamine 2-epimerase [Baekduia sp.]
MAGHRIISGPGLRLVPPQPIKTSTAADHRPIVLHALGGPDDVVLMASLVAALERGGQFRQVVVHACAADTAVTADDLLPDPGMPAPDSWLSVEGDDRTEQLAAMLAGFEAALLDEEPDLVVVAGAGDAALACALAAAKQGVALAHVESGLRQTGGAPSLMALNRVLTDRLADTLLAFSAHDANQLLDEGIPDSRVHAVGHTGIDMLRRHQAAALARQAWSSYGLPVHGYVLVDLGGGEPELDAEVLGAAVDAVARLHTHVPAIVRVRPGTDWAPAENSHLTTLAAAGVRCATDLSYVDALSLLTGAGAVVTDAGALQDEASAVGVACHTLGEDTARAATLLHGTNVLIGADPAAIAEVRPTGEPPVAAAIELWDGRAGERAGETLVAHYVLHSDHGLGVRA